MKQLFRNLTMTAAVLTALLTANPAAAAAAPHTESVTVTRSGGFAGHTEWYAVDSTDRDERAQEALSVTAELRFRVLRPAYLPANPCCDRYRYEVVARYSDGTVKTVVTMDAVPGTPDVLTEVIDLVTTSGALTQA
ncbi:hypothetical protein ACFQFC_07525 [Amorphoplanes digitatis]|uniref:Uncharacterized protein n=1 Tax=Actinoplanes digitatis TaxID=1868 RepID=A0A7W7I094_9ACTN|nr:hypothetical protein [Actinoplanes digitatis]MBB4764052.1 hypothetical protein [Actinoplanes digitatis]GID93872.1 hypothetical protein Adi01nite_32840 [Actinoplanes digitatis]